MENKKTTPPVITGIISTSICFSLGFFTNVFKYNGLIFFYAYIAFLILLCYPTNIVSLYLQKAFPDLLTHSALIKKITKSSKFRPISILLTACILMLVSLIMLNIATYFLDIFDNVTAVDRLSNANLKFSHKFLPNIWLFILFLILCFIFIFFNKKRKYLNETLKSLSRISLYLVVILMLIAVSLPQGMLGIHDFVLNLNYQSDIQLRNMLGLALAYAILSNFISIAFYKNIINIGGDDYKNIQVNAFKSIFYNVIFSFITCATIYAILGNYRIYLQPTEETNISTVFQMLKLNSPLYYLFIEVIFITFNLTVIITVLKYIFEIGNKLYIKATTLAIPFILAIIFINYGINEIDFSIEKHLHVIITFLFLCDVFIIGWIYDAQKLSYQILKDTNTKLSPSFNIMLRIIIPFICIFITIGYIFAYISVMWQIIVSFVCIVAYIIKGSIFSNIFNKRSF
ncbi:MAG: hypothetical protein Kow0076_3840 [Francisella sp.]